jgi:uncharacterized membrane protein
MSNAISIFVWIVFVLTSVYGHVALKLGASALEGEQEARFWMRIADNPWVLSAVGSWIVSGLLWVMIVRHTKLFEAMSISSLRYALVCIAGMLFLHEAIDRRQALGMVLITAGVLLVKTD